MEVEPQVEDGNMDAKRAGQRRGFAIKAKQDGTKRRTAHVGGDDSQTAPTTWTRHALREFGC